MVVQGAATGCEACTEQQAGSPLLANLNANDEAPPPVDYTVIQTRDDFVVIPYTSAFLSGPPDRVTNITLQDRCPRDFIDHVNIPSDPVALQWIQNALGHAGPADPGFAPHC
jgi:triacylglycerol lipase